VLSTRQNFFDKGIVCLLSALSVFLFAASGRTDSGINLEKEKADPVKIGYFFGGRTHVIYRTYVKKGFEEEGVGVELYTRQLYQDGWLKVPCDHDEVTRLRRKDRKSLDKPSRLFGRATGVEIIEGMQQGIFVGGTVGESSFIHAVAKGIPVVAVAMLGYDSPQNPGKVLVLRKDIVINTPQDFKGLRIMSRKAGPGDATFIKEFFVSKGLDPVKDVTILEQIPLDQMEGYFDARKAEGAFWHLQSLNKIVKTGKVYVYQGFDWMNPKLSQALLVFREDFLRDHPREVEKVVKAYMKRLKHEAALPESEKLKNLGSGLTIKHLYQGFSIPVSSYPPYVDIDLLAEVQRLLVQHKEIEGPVDLSLCINNDFVKRVYEETK